MDMQDDKLLDVGNVLTKQKLLKIREVYEFCKNISGRSEANDALNRKFVQIVETATQHIHDFASGKLTIEADAAELMRDYIHEFGREYSVVDGQYVYDYTPDALKAKLKLEQLKYRQKEVSSKEQSKSKTVKEKTKSTEDVSAREKKETGFVIVKPVREQTKPKTENKESRSSEKTSRQKKETEFVIVKPVREQTKPKTVNKESRSSEKTSRQKKETGFVIVKPVREQTKPKTKKKETVRAPRKQRKTANFSPLLRFGRGVKSMAKNAFAFVNNAAKSGYKKAGALWTGVKNTVGSIFSDAKKNVQTFGKRYALAALTLFSSVGANNTYSSSDTINKQVSFKEHLASVRMKTAARNAMFNEEKTTDAVVADSVANDRTAPVDIFEDMAEEVYGGSNDNFEIWNEALNQWRINFDEDEKSEPEATVSDEDWDGYIYTAEDVKAFEPTAAGLEISEQAWDVAENMNSEGYCYRAVKRMFAKADRGMLHGRSAYMAEQYLDTNPFYKKINCGYDAVPYLPDGSCVVLMQNSRHVHGHVFIVGRDENGNVKDLSSKVRNIMRKMKDYGGLRVYLPADTKIPDEVIERRNRCMVLRQNERKDKCFSVAKITHVFVKNNSQNG